MGKILTHAEYFTSLPEPRKSELEALDKLIRKHAPKLERFIQNGFLAYGRWHFQYDSGREGDWFHLGLASNKNYVSFYVCPSDEQGNIADRFRSRLPKASIGKSCIRFKRLSDVDTAVIEEILRAAVRAIQTKR